MAHASFSQRYNNPIEVMRNKSTALILCFFLGFLGGHKFYLGQTGQGLFYFLFSWTFIPGVIAFLELIFLLVMSQQEFDRRYNLTAMLQGVPQQHQVAQQNQVAQNVVINVPGAAPGEYPNVYPAFGAVDVPAKLTQLNDLRVAGALTEAEFAAEKAKLLGASAPAQAHAQLPR